MREVYLDNSATTCAYACVGDLVRKVMCEDYGNPSSMHKKGMEGERYIKEAKEIRQSSGRFRRRKYFLRPAGRRVTIWRLLGRREPTRGQETI